jgi:hypothetical protein
MHSNRFIIHFSQLPLLSLVVFILHLNFLQVASTPIASVHFEITQDDTLTSNVLGNQHQSSRSSSGKPISSNTLSFPQKPEQGCTPNLVGCGVSNVPDYLCGSDGKTYKNIDELYCYRKSCNPGEW